MNECDKWIRKKRKVLKAWTNNEKRNYSQPTQKKNYVVIWTLFFDFTFLPLSNFSPPPSPFWNLFPPWTSAWLLQVAPENPSHIQRRVVCQPQCHLEELTRTFFIFSFPPLSFLAEFFMNITSNALVVQNEKKRESGGPNEIVACTSCGSNSPCTHSANNGCATEVSTIPPTRRLHYWPHLMWIHVCTSLSPRK